MAFEPLEVEVPEVDEDESKFRRFVALSIAVVTLFGALVVYLEARAGSQADRASRDAQRAAATDAQAVVGGQSRFDAAYGEYAESLQVQQEQVVANTEARQNLLADPSLSHHLETEGQEWQKVEDSLTPLSPLLSDEHFNEAKDPQFPTRFWVDTTMESQTVELRQKVDRAASSRWSAKAGHFGGVITLLAVVLFLLGLSLATPEKVRLLLVAPAVVIGAWCLFSAVKEATTKVPTVSENAISLVTDGTRLMDDLQFDPAIAKFSQAIDDSPSFALAYSARSQAHFEKGAHIVPGQTFFAFADAPEVDKAVADGAKAIDLGAGDDVATVGEYAAVLFHARRYSESAAAEEHVIDLNPDNPEAWLNLAAERIALGDDDGAEKALRTGIEKTNARPEKSERDGLYGAELSVFEILDKKEPSKARVTDRFRTELVQAEIEKEQGKSTPGSPTADNVKMALDNGSTELDFDTTGVEEGQSLAVFWYIRTAPDRPFEEAPFMTTIKTTTADEPTSEAVFGAPPQCLEGGDYRADVYLNGKKVGSATETRTPPSFGAASYINDNALGASFCRPLDWTKDSEPGFSDKLTSPDSTQSIEVSQFPLPDGGTANDATLKLYALAGEDSSRLIRQGPMQISNENGESALFRTGEGQELIVAVPAPDTDNVEVIILTAPSDPLQTLNDMVDSLVLFKG